MIDFQVDQESAAVAACAPPIARWAPCHGNPHDAVSPLPNAVIALTTFEFFAQTLGVGTVWNDLSKLSIADLVPSLRSQMDIPDDHLIGYAMGFGWPAVRYARTAPRPAPLINRVRLE